MRHGFGKYECHVSGIMVEGEWRCNRTYPTPSRLEWSVDDDSARDSLVRENPHFPGQFGEDDALLLLLRAPLFHLY